MSTDETTPLLTKNTFPYTREQTAAIVAREFSVALSAGAGCGKTFVLTERFLSHLDPPGDSKAEKTRLSQLVAITFTERAAREMRERIREACAKRLKNCPEAEVEHWRELLRELDSARISTIHSFCGSLLRSHAVEAGLDPRFRVLDAAQSDTLLFELIDRGLRRRLADRDEAVIELVVKFGLDRLREMVGRLLGQRQDLDFPTWHDKTPQELTAIWEKYFRETVYPQMLREIVESEAVGTVTEVARRKSGFCNHPVMQERMATILETLTTISIEKNPDGVRSKLQILKEVARVQGGGTKKNWPGNEPMYNRFRDAAAALRGMIADFDKNASFDAAAALPVAEMGLRLLHLTEEVAAEYESEKASLGVLDFDDLLIHARRLLVGDQRRTIRRRFAEHLRLLLVDEFQDTDPLQVELVKALCDNEVTRGKLFLVGDFKQSIYRFRGADPGVFRLLREEIPERGRLPLSENFRSQPGVIAFVNSLFSDEFGENYEPLRAHRPQTGPLPSVEFMWAIEEAVTSLPTTVVREAGGEGGGDLKSQVSPSLSIENSDVAYTATERHRRREADWIARRIRKMLDVGEKLVGDKESEKKPHPFARAVKKGDIAILFRALTNVAYYEEALRRYGIDYYLVGGHAFFAQQEVFDLLNLLRALETPSDEVALLGVLRSPFFCLLDETIFWLALHREGLSGGLFADKLPPELDEAQAARVRFAAETIGYLRGIKDRVPVARLIRETLDRTAYDAILLGEFLGERKLANLYKLIEQARSFDESGVFCLADFITQLSEFVVRQPKEPLAATQAETMDVVRLMSIHQSKGLQFPVVFVPDLDRRLGGQAPPAVFSKELGPLVKDADIASGFTFYMRVESEEDLAETVRLLYVAATRAADYLVLSSGLDNPENAKNKENETKNEEAKEPELKFKGEWMELLARHFELLTGKSKTGECPIKVIVTKPEPQSTAVDLTIHRRLKTIDEKTRELAEKAEGSWPLYLAPVPAEENARHQMSFSRLSGKLHQHHAAPLPLVEGPGVRAMEDRTDTAPRIDPLGLGTLVHALLEEVDFADPKNFAALVQRHAAEHVGNDRAAVALAIEMLNRFLNSSRAKEVAAAKQLHREMEFLLSWPPESDRSEGKYFQGFIDLLYQDAKGGWHIVDFKTNNITVANFEEVAANYELQMLVYALAAEKILNSPPQELVLHFLRPSQEKSFAWDEAAKKRLMEMVQGVL